MFFVLFQVVLSQLAGFACSVLNAFFGKLPQKLRILSSLTCMIIFLSITTIFTKIVTDHFQDLLFALSMYIMVFLSTSQAILQGSIFGLAGMFPMKYKTAVLTGQSLCGVLAASARIVSLAVGEDQVGGAFIYYIIAIIVMCTTGIVYYAMTKTE